MITIYNTNYLRTGYDNEDITVEQYKEAELTFNEAGKIIKEEHFNADNHLESRIVTSYNENNLPVSVVQYDDKEEICQIDRYEYDEANNKTEEFISYGEQMPEYSTRFLYENGNLVRMDSYDDGDFAYTEKEFFYDQQKLVKEIEYDEEGLPMYTTFNTYDENNLLVKQVRDENQHKDRRTYEFEYDARKNKIKDLIYNYDEALIAKVYYTYNDDNQLVEMEEEDLDNYRLTKFDFEGVNMVKTAVFTKDDQPVSWTEYSYTADHKVELVKAYHQDEVNPEKFRIVSEIRYERS